MILFVYLRDLQMAVGQAQVSVRDDSLKIYFLCSLSARLDGQMKSAQSSTFDLFVGLERSKIGLFRFGSIFDLPLMCAPEACLMACPATRGCVVF